MAETCLIDRQAVIDEITEYGSGDTIYMSVGELKRRIEQLPPAQPEQRWILCSERLPDNDTYVLISKNPHPLTGEKWCVTIAARFADGRSREIQWRDIGFGRLRDVEVIAWMPLPEPYKERREE